MDIQWVMSARAKSYLGGFVGSIIGAYIPTLWGADMLSFSTLFISSLFAILGVIIAYKYFN